MLKRVVLFVCVLTLSLALCLPAFAGPTLDNIKKSGELRMGLDPNYPPLSVTTKTGKIIGLEIDLANMLAAALGVKLKLVPTDFDKLLDTLVAGKVDIVLSGMTITPQRNTKVLFAGPYLVAGQTVVTKDKLALQLRGLPDLNNAKYQVAAVKGSTAAMTVKELLKKTKLVEVKDQEAGLQMVLAGKVDALLCDFPFAQVASFRYRSKGIVGSDKPFTFEPLGIAVRADATQFVNLIQNFLLTVNGSGQMKLLQRRWFQDPSWMQKLQ